MKKFDTVEITTVFELHDIVSTEGAITGIVEVMKEAYEKHYKELGKVRLVSICTDKSKIYYK